MSSILNIHECWLRLVSNAVLDHLLLHNLRIIFLTMGMIARDTFWHQAVWVEANMGYITNSIQFSIRPFCNVCIHVLYLMVADTQHQMPAWKFLVGNIKTHIFFSSNTLSVHLGVTIKLMLNFINLNILACTTVKFMIILRAKEVNHRR